MDITRPQDSLNQCSLALLRDTARRRAFCEAHCAVVEQHPHDVEEVNGEDVEADVCIERRAPGISPWMQGQAILSSPFSSVS